MYIKSPNYDLIMTVISLETDYDWVTPKKFVALKTYLNF
jgi:hypothetical protein